MYDVHRICIDKGTAFSPNGCLVYYFGFNGDWTFQEQMENCGCKVYVFDHKLKNIGDLQHSPNIKLYLMGITYKDATAVVVDETGKNRTSKFGTLSTIYKMMVPEHGEKIIDFIYIEPQFAGKGDEWDIIQNLISSDILKKVRQIEILVKYEPKNSIKEQQNKIRLIKALEDCGFVRFSSLPHASGNFVNQFDFGDYTAFQLSWYNRGLTRKW